MAFRQLKRAAALLLVGEGPERRRLERLSGPLKAIGVSGCQWVRNKIVFHDYVKSSVVRSLMREASVYVMPSNEEEGWGAVVSEALREGCPVVSTFEAGSAITLLSPDVLFNSGDVKALVQILEVANTISSPDGNCEWSGDKAAQFLLSL